ncbi:Ubiquitin_carboxyl-terminal hydrolase family protein [Hexamita inflata]|uniref:Ubiquitin carboxyl-terminal hydrolase n=1 Tax=Hexamita inflata TaxID=28002 RepID=A0AA86TWS0_9EUKA|nr:Ubiquitin carboxyl-terminal hydrolase family protein [Hexamita inflata]
MPFFWQKTVQTPRPGIVNLGATCYVNSALQMLFQTQLIQPSDNELLNELYKLKQQYDKNEQLKPKQFLQQLYKIHDQFEPYTQGDSHELICCLLDDIMRDQNTKEGKLKQFDEDALLKEVYAGGVTPEAIIEYKKKFCLSQMQLHRDAYDSQVQNELKTVEVQAIQCPQCKYESLNYTEGTGVTLEFVQPAEEEEVLKLFLIIPSIKNKKTSIYSAPLSLKQVSESYINYMVRETLENLQIKQVGEFKKDDSLEYVMNTYSLEFQSFSLPESVEYIQNYQNGMYLGMQPEEANEDVKAEKEEVVETDTSKLTSTQITDDTTTNENVEEIQIDLQEDKEDVKAEKAQKQLKKPIQVINGCITNNQKQFKTDHIMFVTIQSTASLQSFGEENLEQQMVTVQFGMYNPISLYLTSIKKEKFESMNMKEKIKYLEEFILPHYYCFGSTNIMAFMKKQFQIKSNFQVDEDNVIQFYIGIVSTDVQNYFTGNKQDLNVMTALTNTKVINLQQMLTLQECIDSNYQQKHQIDGWRCPMCKQEEYGMKFVQLNETSKYLIFDFKRFLVMQNERGIEVQKDSQPVDFPEQLEQCGHKYALKSIVVHYGRLSRGHYMNLSKINGKWLEFNDEYVQETDVEAFKCYAQILLYERCD